MKRHWNFQSIATTDIVAHPQTYLKKEVPTVLVSFARSGNSPESVATVQLAQDLVDELYQITITCAEEGKLAQQATGMSAIYYFSNLKKPMMPALR